MHRPDDRKLPCFDEVAFLEGFAGTTTDLAPVHLGVPIPEPSALLLVGLGLAGVAAMRRRRSRQG